MGRALYYGDNLGILRDEVKSESVDLIYLDPPFNSNATYNVLFKAPSGRRADEQVEAFEDTWHWGEKAELAFTEVVRGSSPAAGLLRALRSFLGENDMMAYLAMMTVRLIEMHRILKATGSLYLHCDPTASHYLKAVLDGIFGVENFINEIVWKRTSGKSDHAQGATHWPRLHDALLYYQKDVRGGALKPTFIEYSQSYIDSKYPHSDADGRRYGLWDMTGPGGAAKGNPKYDVMGVTRYWRYSKERMDQLIHEGRVMQPRSGAVPRYKRYLDEMPGVVVGDVWDDLSPVNSQAKERLGYSTQKPLALLERVIAASTEEGQTVLDPFCGCGTAIHAAERRKRNWIGIDVTHVAIQVIETRLEHAFPGLMIPVIGRPSTLDGARDLARRDKHQFELWAVWLAGGFPRGGKKKGADRGVDGDLYIYLGPTENVHAVISIKGGANINPSMVRDLKGTREREGAELGLFISLEEPSAEMRREAAASGYLETTRLRIPRIQVLTVTELLAGSRVSAAPSHDIVSAATSARQRKRGAKRPDPRQREILYPLPIDTPAGALAEQAALSIGSLATQPMPMPPYLHVVQKRRA